MVIPKCSLSTHFRVRVPCEPEPRLPLSRDGRGCMWPCADTLLRPTSYRNRAESDGQFGASLTSPVSYMSSWNQAPSCSNFVIGNWLLDISSPPLPRPPGCLGSSSPSCPESSSDDCSAGYPERNPESCVDGCSVGYSAGYPEENSASCRESCRESCSPSCSAVSPENRSAGSPESSLPSNSERNWESYSEGCRANRLPGAFPNLESPSEHDLSHSLQLVA